MTCKPNSVYDGYLSSRCVAAPIERFLRAADNLDPYVLHRTGFTQPAALPRRRWAFTSPFHPYRKSPWL